MTKLSRRTQEPSARTVRIETTEGEWFTWLRTRTPLLGARRDRLMRLRPGGRSMAPKAAAGTAALAATAAILGAGGVATLMGTLAVALVAVTVCTIPWVPQQRRHARDLRPGDIVRVPRKPWAAGIVMKADTYNDLTYLELLGEHHLVFESRREVARIYFDGKLAHQWVYGRVPAQTMQHRDHSRHRSWWRR